MRYTKKDYQDIAKILAVQKDNINHIHFEKLVLDFARLFLQDNKNFQLSKFFEACNYIQKV